ncbi:MAG: tRNA pseudouridine(55) synthase TruB [Candidatus Omnitrophica bacterium]|nr:tRNA pseudouridine(55) synthase TruB [Candidatus Omnitrophota bacterium]
MVQKRNDKEGILLVDKPSGMTSHDVVDVVRRRLDMQKVGHAGTLDPLAEGLLVMLVGKATKLFSKFVNFDKEYIGVLKLGEVTSTGDSQGEVLTCADYSDIDMEKLKKAFLQFEGETDQIPPMVSALRIKGKRLYSLARKGITVERKPRRIKISPLEIQEVNFPFVQFYAHCSKGTYIRKLAEDIGEVLGCGAHIVKIMRLSIGPFKLEDAIKMDNISEASLRPYCL